MTNPNWHVTVFHRWTQYVIILIPNFSDVLGLAKNLDEDGVYETESQVFSTALWN